ncbi:MAG: 1-deoxy-D-xylulose-5-phosphate reductoisomerase [bacterium]|nr:1-deoxy-D-xylulose-5-phosphate reductoisomerase [bacterium]
MKNIAVLGATGSIGRNTLEIVESFPDKFKVTAISGKANVNLLEKQINQFHPKFVVVMDENTQNQLCGRIKDKKIKIEYGDESLVKISTLDEVDIVVSAITGITGLIPTLEAIKKGKHIAIAAKELLVAAGEIMLKEVRKNRVKLLPVDSEHNAIFQCVEGKSKKDIKRIILTASGGPFYKEKNLHNISPEQALAHPVWEMGRKISIDSATLMNKGLEVIEAHWLFGIDISKIEIIIHPECIIHSMVEFIDGSVFALLGIPDMKMPIQYALTYPERMPTQLEPLDLTKISLFHFSVPNFDKFPCLKLAYEAGTIGGTMPAVLNSANDVAVNLFLKKKIKFSYIPQLIEKVMNKHNVIQNPCLDDILESDAWARETCLL